MIRIICFSLFLLISLNAISQSSASPQVSRISLEATQLDTIKEIWIYLPKAYQTTKKKYPVIYMHDAQNLFDKETSYVGEWNVDESLDSLVKPEAIIVGIEHGGNKRIDELTPFSNDKYGGGKADAYLDFILQTLKPHIDREYRTKKEARHTGIFGSSLGGLISFYAALKYPDTFGMAGVYSPSFWFNYKIYDYVEEKDLDPKTRFYFLAGKAESEEMIPDLEKMIELLKEKGLQSSNFKVDYIEDGEHNEALWRENFPATYLWFMDNSGL